MVPEVRLEPARPFALSRLLPLRRLHHVGMRQVVEGHVFPVATGAAEASRAEDARHGAEGGDVLGVVPLVELGLGDLRHVHGRDQRAFRHCLLLPVCGGYCIMPLSVSHLWMSWATWTEFLSIIIMWPLPVMPSLGSSHQSATPPSARR